MNKIKDIEDLLKQDSAEGEAEEQPTAKQPKAEPKYDLFNSAMNHKGQLNAQQIMQTILPIETRLASISQFFSSQTKLASSMRLLKIFSQVKQNKSELNKRFLKFLENNNNILYRYIENQNIDEQINDNQKIDEQINNNTQLLQELNSYKDQVPSEEERCQKIKVQKPSGFINYKQLMTVVK